MQGFRANKLQRNVAKALLRGFGFTFFSAGDVNLRDRDSTLALQGLYSYAIGTLLQRDWGFTQALLGIYKTSIGDSLKLSLGFTEKARAR